MSINALMQLWTELHTKQGYTFLLTSGLNQDCIENMFSIIRGENEKWDNPDRQQFKAAFRQAAVDQLLKSNDNGVIDTTLLSLNNMSEN